MVLCGALRSLQERAWLDRASEEAVRRHADSGAVWLARAESLEAAGRHEDRLACVERALALLPDEAEPRKRKAFALLALKRPQEALDEFDRGLALRANDLDAAHGRALALHALGKDAEAEASLREVARTYARDGDAWNWLGTFLCNELRAYERGVDALREAVRRNPSFAVYHYNLGNALAGSVVRRRPKQLGAEDRRRLEAAAGEAAEAIRLDPTTGAYHDNLGTLLGRLGQSEKALDQYRLSVQLDPQDALARFNLGTLLAKSDSGGAATAYREALRLDPSRDDARANLALLLLDAGDVEGAIEQATAVLRSATEHGKTPDALPAAHSALGLAQLRRGGVASAITSFEAALAIDPDDAHVRSNLALALRRAGRTDESIRALTQALHDGGPDAFAYNELGNALATKGDKQGSLEAYRKALAADPAHWMAWNNMGRRLWEQDDRPGAIDAYRKAVHLCPGDSQAQDNLGYALLNCDRAEESVEHFLAAARADPRSHFPLWNLGAAYARLDRFEEALPPLRRALELARESSLDCTTLDGLLQRCERHAAGARALDETARGGALPAEGSLLASMSEVAYKRKKYGESTELGLAAFRASPALAENLAEHCRYNAACAAVLAGCGRGDDAPCFDTGARSRWRKQGLAWLRADLALWSRTIDGSDADARARGRSTLQHWLGDSDFAPLRDGARPTEVTEEERADWEALWARVRGVVQRATGDVAPR